MLGGIGDEVHIRPTPLFMPLPGTASYSLPAPSNLALPGPSPLSQSHTPPLSPSLPMVPWQLATAQHRRL